MSYNNWVNWESWNYNLMFCDGDEIYELGLYHGDDCEYYTKPYSVYDIADHLKEEMEEYYADEEGTLFSSFTESALQKISFDEIAEKHYDEYLEAYQEGKDNRPDWKVNYYKKEEPEAEEPEEVEPEEVEPEEVEPVKVLLDKEFWVRARFSSGEWGEVELTGEQITEYTTRETNETESDFMSRREAIIKKAVEEVEE